MAWLWDSKRKRYRDAKTKAYLSKAQVLGLRDSFVEAQKGKATNLAQQLAAGDLTPAQWETAMRAHIKDTYVDLYALGRGGRNAMTKADWGRIGLMLANQYDYLRKFRADIERRLAHDGRLPLQRVAARARIYIAGGTQAFERGKAAAFGLDLPAYPGDGQTECLGHCKCAWLIVETAKDWECTWQLGHAEHCDDCHANARAWNPLVIPKAAGAPPPPPPPPGGPEYAALRSQVISEWVNSSRSAFSVAVKQAISQELGVPGLVHNPDRRPIDPALVERLKPVVREMYEETQLDLRARGITSFTLYRGLMRATRGKIVMESWSEELEIAEGYGKYTTIRTEVPADRVLLWYDGPGWRGEHPTGQLEFLVLQEAPK